MSDITSISHLSAAIANPSAQLRPYPNPPIGSHATIAGSTTFDDDSYEPFDASFDVDGAAARILAAYDRNNDGTLSVGVSWWSEAVKLVSDDGDTADISLLAEQADAQGNNDGAVTVDEIAKVIGRFDLNGGADGRLSGPERTNFLSVFGEHREYPNPVEARPPFGGRS